MVFKLCIWSLCCHLQESSKTSIYVVLKLRLPIIKCIWPPKGSIAESLLDTHYRQTQNTNRNINVVLTLQKNIAYLKQLKQ